MKIKIIVMALLMGVLTASSQEINATQDEMFVAIDETFVTPRANGFIRVGETSVPMNRGDAVAIFNNGFTIMNRDSVITVIDYEQALIVTRGKVILISDEVGKVTHSSRLFTTPEDKNITGRIITTSGLIIDFTIPDSLSGNLSIVTTQM